MSNKVYIIAEAGVNHNGDFSLAKKLVDVASSAGVDAVKFQAFRTKDLILENINKAPYQKTSTSKNISQTEMLRSLELKLEHYSELKNYCENKSMDFLITPFDYTSLEELELLKLKAYKVSSTDATNIPFLRKIAKTGKKIILSTGMCYMSEVEKAVKTIREFNDDLILMQCTANYPINDSEANLNVLKSYKKFKCDLGYSDHTKGIGASLFAIPMGVKMVEKHFTLSKDLSGPDHSASLDPIELQDYVKQIRKVEQYLGSDIKEPTKSEMETRKSLQKCLVANKKIKKGEVFSNQNIVAKRTGGIGISPINCDDVFGMIAKRSFNFNEIIEFE